MIDFPVYNSNIYWALVLDGHMLLAVRQQDVMQWLCGEAKLKCMCMDWKVG